jgi:hypothetical protein
LQEDLPAMQKQFGQTVSVITVDGKRHDALIIGVRSEPAELIGANGEELLSLGYFTPGATFGTANPVIMHDVIHTSVGKGLIGARWEDVGQHATTSETTSAENPLNAETATGQKAAGWDQAV